MADKKTVLIVDDEEDIITSIDQVLKASGFETITAEDGEKALEILKETKPDLLLLDIMMPGITAREVVEKIRADDRLKDLKVMYLTAVVVSDAEEKQILKDYGILDYIQKPVDVDNLLARIKKAL